MDEGIIPLTISYEDENGTISTETKELTLFVTEAMPEDTEWSTEAGNMDDVEMAEPTSLKDKFMALPMVARVGIAVGVAVVFVGIIIGIKAIIRHRKNKKQQLAEEEGIDDEIS